LPSTCTQLAESLFDCVCLSECLLTKYNLQAPSQAQSLSQSQASFRFEVAKYWPKLIRYAR